MRRNTHRVSLRSVSGPAAPKFDWPREGRNRRPGCGGVGILISVVLFAGLRGLTGLGGGVSHQSAHTTAHPVVKTTIAAPIPRVPQAVHSQLRRRHRSGRGRHLTR